MVYRSDRFVELHRCSNVPVEKGKIIVDAFLKKKKKEMKEYFSGAFILRWIFRTRIVFHDKV